MVVFLVLLDPWISQEVHEDYLRRSPSLVSVIYGEIPDDLDKNDPVSAGLLRGDDAFGAQGWGTGHLL